MKKLLVHLFVVAGVSIAAACSCMAQTSNYQDGTLNARPKAEEASRIHWTAEKLARGVTNIVTGIGEVPIKMCQRSKLDNSNASGMTIGFLEGIGWSLLRIGAGLWDTITWPGSLIIPDEQSLIEPPTIFDYDEPCK